MDQNPLNSVFERHKVTPTDLIHHLFLPKRLPQSEPTNLANIELAILEYLTLTSASTLLHHNLQKTHTTLQTWISFQSTRHDAKKILTSLPNGETCCFYVTSQNCTIMFTRYADNMRVITFRSSLPNELVATSGSVLVNYPETIDLVPRSDLLLSDCFSNQLAYLVSNTSEIAMPKTYKAGKYHLETREPSFPYVVSEYLVGMLCPQDQMDQVNTVKVQKKLRDTVNWQHCDVPFRRSGMWMAIKVVIQMSLKEQMKEHGYVVYKILVLKTLASLGVEYTNMTGASWDVTSNILVKLSRRAKKLCEMNTHGNEPLESLRNETLTQVLSTVETINGLVSNQWKQLSFPPTHSVLEVRKVTHGKRNWINDCVHYMSNLTSYLDTERIPASLGTVAVDNLKMIDPVVQMKNQTLESLLNRFTTGLPTSQQDHHLNNLSVWIHQVEWFVRNTLSKHHNCKNVFELLCAYSRTVFLLYGKTYSDPVYYSRMTITVLKLVGVLDEIAVGVHPLLRNYKTGIENHMFENLLIAEKTDMVLVEQLQIYFSNRNLIVYHTNWLGSSELNSTSFPVKFAEGNNNMMLLKAKILNDSETRIEAKKQEIVRTQTECNELQRQINARSCSYTYNSYYERNDHDYNCARCSLVSQLNTKRKSVNRYQRPLPPEEYLRNAVVFELLIPQEIAYLRDGVCILLHEILGHKLLSPVLKSENIHTNWMVFRELLEYTHNGHQKLVHLASQLKDTLTTHYGRENPDVFSTESAFILENGLNCRNYKVRLLGEESITNPFTLQINTTSPKEAEAYACLQQSLSPNRQTENQVIANQYVCHQNLNLKEFIAYGSVRCGHNIQVRNLYAAIASHVVSLDKEPVVAMIIQSVWELGPGEREIYADFELEGFSQEFLDLMSKLCDENTTNWSNPMALLSLTIITVKILEMTGSVDVKRSASGVLQKYRDVIEEWCVKLEALISRSSDTDKKEEKVLMNLLVKCSICSAFTFNVSTHDNLSYVFKDPTDVTYYLKTLSRLHHLVVRENILKTNSLSHFIQNLLRHARVTIPLNLQDYLHTKFRETPWNNQLHDFVCSKWITAREVDRLNIPTFHVETQDQKAHAYQATYTSHVVCIDILRGTFFVDGFPPSLLPEHIIRHPLYKSFFRTSKFRVQRDSRTFRTVDEYCGHHFEFTDVGVDGLVVRQRTKGREYLELLPRELFEHQVAHDFIDNFTHWYDSETRVVYFRRVSLTDKQLEVKHDTDYVLKPTGKGFQEWHLVKYNGNSTNDCFIVSITSKGFKKITKTLQKLEHHRYIHVHCEQVEDENRNRSLTITAKLWRFNMSFSLHHMNGLVYCDNYPDYYVSVLERQSLGTLVGLQSGLVLERKTESEVGGRKRLFVVQHGSLEISNKVIWMKHQVVNVSLDNRAMRNPPYFVYEVDQVLKSLRPGNSKSAWLYLAALHAATSSPFPDPFTELTGTEMAMWILQSGFVWSCSPYDDECINTLEQIGSLSPTYSYYPPHLKKMITTEWPHGLDKNSYAAFDGYAIVKEKLLQDCSRLAGLFRQKSRSSSKINVELCTRSYYRNLNYYNHVAHLSDEFINDSERGIDDSFHKLACYQKQEKRSDLVKLANFRHQRTPSSYSAPVTSFIMTTDPLPHSLEDTVTGEYLDSWFSKDLRTHWLQVYSLCKNSPTKFEHNLTLMFGAMVYSGGGCVNQVLNLHNVSVLSDRFPDPVRSLTFSAYEPLNNEFKHDSIVMILRQVADSPPSSSSYSTFKKYEEAEREFRANLNSQSNNAGYQVRLYWPAQSISSGDLQRAVSSHHVLNSTSRCLQLINGLFLQWFNNLGLKRFVGEVDGVLRNVIGCGVVQKHAGRYLVCQVVLDVADRWVKQEFSFQRISFHSPEEAVAKAKQIFSTGQVQEDRSGCMDLADEIADHLQTRVLGNCPVKIGLRNAGIHVRLAPVILLKNYVSKWKFIKDQPVAQFIGCLAVIWTNIKRLNRIALYQHDETKYSVELAREMETQNERSTRDNWKPTEHPEWLLLELELDVTIRPVQEDVARHMMSMPGCKNGVMQLNMGEGKTSVIVPMVVSTLALNTNMMCRVTVLNSIFATNWNLLSFAIGGFLNRRVYTVPCSRDIDVSKYLDNMMLSYNECVKLSGVVITLPEYRLSFRLQMYNCVLRDRVDVGRRIYEIEDWLRRHARDVVDESDEVFSVKYQLVYTTGKQCHVDGGNMRWRVCQKVFELIPQVAGKLFEMYGPDVVEFQPEVAKESPEQFTHVRILSDECKREFYELVADGILDGGVDLLGQILSEEERGVVKEFLVNEGISEVDHYKLSQLGLQPCKKEILLLVSGYLRRGIIFAALKKRWRVDCGVKIPKPGVSSKLMAVPFRAKDVAAERTEFGHPDMAIVLTQLSYYYSGLSDDQLIQCFELLDTSVTGADGVYNGWVKRIPEQKILHDSVRTYSGVNLQDYEQRTKWLFPVLRWHKGVIDFWLENVAFPKECKQFPGKLVTNAWDLCYEKCVHPTTGFSGTNDTSLLLPAQVTQQDLHVLMETNNVMEETLKGGENECRRILEMGVTCRQVLEFMIDDGLRVLIDAGALMLELGNSEIADLWLELDKRLEGVVYFNERGEMAIKARRHGYRKREKDQLLTLSSFRDRLERCAVYLDDQHTRGTDIKLPRMFKACVTVGSGMRRDKLIQACMRMRKLGRGQSVCFYLSREVGNKICNKGSSVISVCDILDWVKWNSCQFEKDGLVFWATNGKNYGKNLVCDELFELSGKGDGDLKVLGVGCQDPDAQMLEQMYGVFHHRVLLVELIGRWFRGVRAKLGGGCGLPVTVEETMGRIEQSVLAKCWKHIPDQVQFHSLLEEEQEKELEPEQEELVEKYRPPAETALNPCLHQEVVNCVMLTGVPTVCDGICSLAGMFNRTNLWGVIQHHGWGSRWFVTQNFIKVIERLGGEKLDCFLRQIRYFVSFKSEEMVTSVMVLSQFEANAFIQMFRGSKQAGSGVLHMFSGRWMDGQSIFANNPRLQVPLDVRNNGRMLDEVCKAPLLVAAGNLYFDSMEEQKAFARFLGLALRPWTEDEERAYQDKFISTTGFVSPKCLGLRDGTGFQNDPTEMVRGILKFRNEVLRDNDHVVLMLERCGFILG